MKNTMLNTARLLTFAFSISLLSGCAASYQGDSALKDRVTALEAENRTLKLQLEQTRQIVAAKATASDRARADAGTDVAADSRPASREAAVEQTGFTDLGGHPAEDMITELASLKVFGGTGSTFHPNETITRAEYCKWLYKAYNAIMPEQKQLRLTPASAQIFRDCTPAHPDYEYVQALANAGYSIGYDDGTFKPEQPLTREEMLGIKLGVDVGKKLDPWRSQMEAVWKFSDGKQVSERFTGYVHQDYYVSGPHGCNIQRAFGKIGAFRPKQPVLRAEAAATLWQIGQFGETQKTTAAAALKEKVDKT